MAELRQGDRGSARRVVDLHSHALFGLDDGPRAIDESLEILRLLRNQGVSDVFCTAHSWGAATKYSEHFAQLQAQIASKGIDVAIHPGMEIFCDPELVSPIIRALDLGGYQTLAGTNRILLEFPRDIHPKAVCVCVKRFLEFSEYRPVIAHVERYDLLSRSPAVFTVLNRDEIELQINAYSLAQEPKEEVRAFARRLLSEKLVSFLGTDSHRLDHRPPEVSEGVRYLYESCDPVYADAVAFGNADRVFLQRPAT